MKPAIIDIPGIGPAAVDTLSEHGINKLNQLAGASIEQIAAVPGFSAARAARAIAAATDLLAAAGLTRTVKEKPGRSAKQGKPGRRDKKGKKDKKDKKHKKDKKRKGKGKGKDKKKSGK